MKNAVPANPADPFELARFVAAQAKAYADVVEELRAGRKRSHWMWFVFPQMKGLGSSHNAEFFGIGSRPEAVAYLQHPVLGSRLRECTELVNAVEGRTAEEIFGAIDAVKFRSSMTLFAQAAPDEKIFREALNKYYGGEADPLTLNLPSIT
jgi:uncharacterized protein (DUF1810 family)